MSIITSQSFGAISSVVPTGLQETLNEVFDISYGKKPLQLERFMKVLDSDDAFEDDQQIQMPSEIEPAAEGGSYARVEIIPVRTKRYIHVTYKGEVKITTEAEEDIKYPRMIAGAEALGIAARRTLDRKAAALLYNGFTSEQSPDAVSIFNTAHPLYSPQAGRPTTFSNRSQLKLNAVNLKARRAAMGKQLDENGDLAPVTPDKLIVPIDLSWDAMQLKQSALEPFTANNQKNVVADGLEVVVLNFLSEAPTWSDTMWFLMDSEVARLKFFWRRKPRSRIVTEEKTGDTLYRVDFRFSLGCSSAHGLDGNTGQI